VYLPEKLISKHVPLKSEHKIYRLTRGLNPGSSDRPSQSVRTVSQPTEPPRQITTELMIAGIIRGLVRVEQFSTEPWLLLIMFDLYNFLLNVSFTHWASFTSVHIYVMLHKCP